MVALEGFLTPTRVGGAEPIGVFGHICVVFVHLSADLLEAGMILHLLSGNIMFPDFPKGKRSAVQIGGEVPIHISVYHGPLIQFWQPYFVHYVAFRVILIAWHTSDISGIQTGSEQQLKGEKAMRPSVECGFDIFRVFPQINGISVLQICVLIGIEKTIRCSHGMISNFDLSKQSYGFYTTSLLALPRRCLQHFS